MVLTFKKMFPLGRECELVLFRQNSLNLAVIFLTTHFLSISGKPLCAALCGVCPLKFSWIYPGLPRGPVRVQCAQV